MSRPPPLVFLNIGVFAYKHDSCHFCVQQFLCPKTIHRLGAKTQARAAQQQTKRVVHYSTCTTKRVSSSCILYRCVGLQVEQTQFGISLSVFWFRGFQNMVSSFWFKQFHTFTRGPIRESVVRVIL